MTHRFSILLLCLLAIPAVHATDTAAPPDLKARNSKLALTWLEPEASLAPFTKVMLAPTTFGYRDAKPVTGLTGADSSRTEFPVEPSDRKLFEKNVQEVFHKELGKRKHYALTDQAGPGVLVVKTSVLDYVSHIPPEPNGRADMYVDTVGEGTLLLELDDGATGRTVARAADRRVAEPASSRGGFGNLRSTPPLVQNEVRQMAGRWGRAMGDRLDQLYFATKPK